MIGRAGVLLLASLVGRTYWSTPVRTLATGAARHTHVAVTGRVAYVRAEDDGDMHMKIVSTVPGDTTWIIAECIPKLPCRRPTPNEIVTVKGISRKDPEHGWYEVHPVEEGP